MLERIEAENALGFKWEEKAVYGGKRQTYLCIEMKDEMFDWKQTS